MHNKKTTRWFFYVCLVLMMGCRGGSGPVTEGSSREADASAQAVASDQTPSSPTATETDLDATTSSSEHPDPSVERRLIPGVNQPNTPDLADDGIHDPDNPALATMQSPFQALSALPIGRWKEIDWMQALKRGDIQPRAGLETEGGMEALDLDIIMTNTKSMPHVRFPHSAHTKWLACSNCHPDIFIPKKGANAITMNAILKGQFCGICHGKVAFSSYICQRCHSVTHEGSPQQWWK